MGIYDREYYRDSTRGSGFFSGTAPACKTIILINVLVFLAQSIGRSDVLATWFAASSKGIFERYHVWQLLTSAFLHSGVFHIAVNMLLLWWFGREMESMYGSRDFTAMYLTAAILSTLCWATIDYLGKDEGIPALGASGAVMAVVVLYTCYYPRRELLLFGLLPIEMWLLLVIYIGGDLLNLLQEFREGPSLRIAFGAHLGGAAYGFLFKAGDLRWSRLLSSRPRRPRLRVVSAEPRDKVSPLPTGGQSRSATASATPPRPNQASGFPEEQLNARLDEVLAKIAREGRGGLTDDENRVLQEASRRARDRRSDRI